MPGATFIAPGSVLPSVSGLLAKRYLNKPADGITRASNTIGAFSTPWQITGVVVAPGQNVRLHASVSKTDGGANGDFILCYLRGASQIASTIWASPPAAFHVDYEWIDENPGGGTYTYEIQAAIFVGTLTIKQTLVTTDAGGGSSLFVAEVYTP